MREPGRRRAQILRVAADHFGRRGYDETKWADIAAAVGVGPTALYHYFESKQHCLFEIMAEAVAEFRLDFDRIVAGHDDWTAGLVAVLRNGFELSEADVLRRRVLAAEHARSRVRSAQPREEVARTSALSRKRDLEFAWGAFLARGMQQGALPERDPQLLARALIGLYNSVWVWYRPGGTRSLDTVGPFFVRRELELLGVVAHT
jgi:TetR/AcrR family transcriptional regulator, cholesterol catabolism regulator